jgi:hypothetical protein
MGPRLERKKKGLADRAKEFVKLFSSTGTLGCVDFANPTHARVPVLLRHSPGPFFRGPRSPEPQQCEAFSLDC